MKLIVNGSEVDDLNVTGFSYNGTSDILYVTTLRDEQLVVKGDVPDPEPTPTPDPDPDPVQDPEHEPGENVIRRYDFNDPLKEQKGYWITIPKGVIVSSRIPAGISGSVHLQQLESPKPQFDFWISETPGGPPVGPYCKADKSNFVLSKEFFSEGGFSWNCRLADNKPHYLNIRHTDPNQPASRINRKIYS